jgi:ADP-ribose pyrophosphatase
MYTGRVFGVRRDRVIEPGGVKSTRDVVTHAGSVVVLPILPDGRLLLVRQYRHAVGRYLWELVAGRIEPGERPLEAAGRELAEETGYTGRGFRKLLDVFPTPGFVSERMLVYAAEGLTPGASRPEADERIRLGRFTLRELEVMIHRGRLRDAKSIAGILYYSRFCRKKREHSSRFLRRCQRKVEMSGFSQDRNVRFQGLLQG